jgi:hypothetical protein
MRYVFVLLVGLLAAACSDSGAQQTLVADNAALGTQISDIRAKATLERDVLQITIEALNLAMTQTVRQNQEISVTLQAAGIDPTAIAQVKPVPGAVSGPTAVPQQTLVSQPGATPEVVAGTLDITVVVPTPTLGQPTLYNMVMAEGVGDNDCALASVTNFNSAAKRIYVVATAANIAPGTALGSQWYREGELLVSPTFTPDFAIDQNCIWFYVDQTDFNFTPGNYTVQMTINDTAVGQPIPFTITG